MDADSVYGNLQSLPEGKLYSGEKPSGRAEDNIYDNFCRPRSDGKWKKQGWNQENGGPKGFTGLELSEAAVPPRPPKGGQEIPITEAVQSRPPKTGQGISFTEPTPMRPPKIGQGISFTEPTPMRPPKIGLDFSSPAVDAAFRPPEEKEKPVPASPGSPSGGCRAILVISVMLAVSFLVCLVLISLAFINNSRTAEELKAFHAGHSESGSHVSTNLSDVKAMQERYRAELVKALQNLESTVGSQGLSAGKERERIQTEMNKALADLQALVSTDLEDAKKNGEKMKKDLTDLQNVVTKDRADAKKERQQIQADLKTGLAALRTKIDAICKACPSGWERFEQSCYFYSKTTQPWQTARDGCINLASHLAIITDSKEQTFLKTKYTSQLYWIGLSDQSKEGDWLWVDGSKPAFFSWSSGQPDNRGDEDCVVMEPTGFWSDYSCSYTTHWICEKTWTC